MICQATLLQSSNTQRVTKAIVKQYRIEMVDVGISNKRPELMIIFQ